MTSRKLPVGKELCKLMMDWEIYDQECFGGKVEKHVRISCPNCTCKKCNLLSNGWTNYTAHYKSCVGENNLEELVRLQQRKLENENILVGNATSASLKSHFVVATEEQKSTHMWLQFMCLKNMSIISVQCEIMRANVKFPATKSSRTVMETGHCLAEIVEEKIAVMMRATAKGNYCLMGGLQTESIVLRCLPRSWSCLKPSIRGIGHPKGGMNVVCLLLHLCLQ